MYPTTIPDALQEALLEWYQYREVADDEKFETWYLRHLNRDYPRYAQILRIEAGVSQYDWLVQNYKEQQHYYTGQTQEETNRTLDRETLGTATDTGNTSKTLATTGSDTTATTYGKTLTTNNQTTDGGGITTTRTLNTSDVHSGTLTRQDTLNVDRTDKLTDTRKTNTYGGYTDTTTDGRTTTDTTNIETVGGDNSTRSTVGWNTVNQKTLEKANPMSISYSTGVAEPVGGNDPAGNTATAGGTLDWATPSAQAANFGKNTNGETVTEHQGHIQNTTTRSIDGDTSTTRNNDETIQHSGGTETKHTGNEQHNVVDTDARSVSHSGDVTDSKILDTIGTESGTQTAGGVDSTTRTLGTTQTTTGTGTSTNSTTGTETTAEDSGRLSQRDSLSQDIYTGRHDDPATLLQKAASYIMTTNAFEWLCKQLDVCFIGVYDI